MRRMLIAAALLCMVSFRVPAQKAPEEQMLSSSVIVYAAIQQNGKAVPVNRAAGFLMEATHVVTNLRECCGATSRGEHPVPVVVSGKDTAVGKVIWSSDESETALLELDSALKGAAVTFAPSKLTYKGEDVYSVQFPEPSGSGSPKISSGKIQGTAKIKDTDLLVYQTTASMDEGNSGGALFDACGNAIGINIAVKDGVQYALAVDALAGAFKARGLKAKMAEKGCGSNASAKGASKGEGGGEEASGHGWRMPRGTEWIPVIVMAGILVLALRPGARRALGRPQVAPVLPFPPAAAVGKPVLRGITGDYSGASLSLDTSASTLGRDPHRANLLFGPDSDAVSKRHCTVKWDAQRQVFVLEDHGSTNGTFLASGERLNAHQSRDLRPGDRFYIGDLRNQFEVCLET